MAEVAPRSPLSSRKPLSRLVSFLQAMLVVGMLGYGAVALGIFASLGCTCTPEPMVNPEPQTPASPDEPAPEPPHVGEPQAQPGLPK